MNLLFWNIQKKPVEHVLAAMARHHDIDFIFLAECPANTPQQLIEHQLLNGKYQEIPLERKRLRIISRCSKSAVLSYRDDQYYCLLEIALPGQMTVLLTAVHLPSKRHKTGVDQLIRAGFLGAEIRTKEAELKHARTVVFGDFNMSPFEEGMISANGLHGVMSRELAAKESREVERKSYPYFYNPMWGRFGDATPGPPGTYYYAKSGYTCHFWHTFDQVLVRPALLQRFRTESIHVYAIEDIMREYNVSRKADLSDHSPLIFSLDLKQ